MSFEDKPLRCVTCGAQFIWTAGEQGYFADRHVGHEPRHCRRCRAKAGRARATVLEAGRRGVEMAATCSACGRSTTVPFKPALGRPVFCRECYHHRKTRGAGRA